MGSLFTSNTQTRTDGNLFTRATHRIHLGIHLRNVGTKAFEESFKTTQKDTKQPNK